MPRQLAAAAIPQSVRLNQSTFPPLSPLPIASISTRSFVLLAASDLAEGKGREEKGRGGRRRLANGMQIMATTKILLCQHYVHNVVCH